eukprot:2660994-Pleurochrysis_carterae.AAC.1
MWPSDARDALRRGAATARERAREGREAGPNPRPVLLMPTAELFGAWAVAEARGDASRVTAPSAVIAVGD